MTSMSRIIETMAVIQMPNENKPKFVSKSEVGCVYNEVSATDCNLRTVCMFLLVEINFPWWFEYSGICNYLFFIGYFWLLLNYVVSSYVYVLIIDIFLFILIFLNIRVRLSIRKIPHLYVVARRMELEIILVEKIKETQYIYTFTT